MKDLLVASGLTGTNTAATDILVLVLCGPQLLIPGVDTKERVCWMVCSVLQDAAKLSSEVAVPFCNSTSNE